MTPGWEADMVDEDKEDALVAYKVDECCSRANAFEETKEADVPEVIFPSVASRLSSPPLALVLAMP
jgi:hypothetical protein